VASKLCGMVLLRRRDVGLSQERGQQIKQPSKVRSTRSTREEKNQGTRKKVITRGNQDERTGLGFKLQGEEKRRN